MIKRAKRKKMKKIKWYFSHINWKVVLFYFILLNAVTLIDGDFPGTFPNLWMNLMLVVMAILAPLAAITHKKIWKI